MKREKLTSYTERAIRATEAGKLIPPIVYLPRLLRSKPVLVTTDLPDARAYKVAPPSVEQTTVRIQEADPLGFLIAIMHGQPIPEFRVTKTGNIELFYAVPKLQERIRAAEFMAGRHYRGRKPGNTPAIDDDETTDHAALVAARAASSSPDADSYDNSDVVETSDPDNE